MSERYNFYAVAVGREPGIYDNWGEAKRQVDKYPSNIYKGFQTREEAEMFLLSYEMEKLSLKASATVPQEETEALEQKEISSSEVKNEADDEESVRSTEEVQKVERESASEKVETDVKVESVSEQVSASVEDHKAVLTSSSNAISLKEEISSDNRETTVKREDKLIPTDSSIVPAPASADAWSIAPRDKCNEEKIYAVAHGRKTGIFPSWSEAGQLVNNFSSAKHKSFANTDQGWAQAIEYLHDLQ